MSQTRKAGFATERTILLQQVTEGTEIRAEAYVVGRPEMGGGAAEFLKSLTIRWFNELAHYCDNEALSVSDSH